MEKTVEKEQVWNELGKNGQVGARSTHLPRGLGQTNISH